MDQFVRLHLNSAVAVVAVVKVVVEADRNAASVEIVAVPAADRAHKDLAPKDHVQKDRVQKDRVRLRGHVRLQGQAVVDHVPSRHVLRDVHLAIAKSLVR